MHLLFISKLQWYFSCLCKTQENGDVLFIWVREIIINHQRPLLLDHFNEVVQFVVLKSGRLQYTFSISGFSIYTQRVSKVLVHRSLKMLKIIKGFLWLNCMRGSYVVKKKFILLKTKCVTIGSLCYRAYFIYLSAQQQLHFNPEQNSLQDRSATLHCTKLYHQ